MVEILMDLPLIFLVPSGDLDESSLNETDPNITALITAPAKNTTNSG